MAPLATWRLLILHTDYEVKAVFFSKMGPSGFARRDVKCFEVVISSQQFLSVINSGQQQFV